MYGTPFRKATAILTNCSALLELPRRCNHSRHDVILQGTVMTSAGTINYTKLAAQYPDDLCNKWVSLLRAVCHEDSLLPAGAAATAELDLGRIPAQPFHAQRRAVS